MKIIFFVRGLFSSAEAGKKEAVALKTRYQRATARRKKTGGGVKKPLNYLVLSLLFAGPLLSTPSATGMEENYRLCEKYDEGGTVGWGLLEGWVLSEGVLHPSSETGLKPFPKLIIIEGNGEKGTLKIIPDSDSEFNFKVYPFLFEETTQLQSRQHYDNPFEDQAYTLTETADISFQEGVLTLNLTWTKDVPGEKIKTVTESYQFCRDTKNNMIFTRIINNPYAPVSTSQAFYRIGSPKRHLSIPGKSTGGSGGE